MTIGKKSACLFFLNLALFTQLISGCAEKNRVPLVENPAFLHDLSHAQTKGVKGIALVAPSSGFTEAGRAAVYALAETIPVSFPKTAVRPGIIPYNAHSDDIRLSLLAKALHDPEVEIIWAVRGGYGASRLLEGLDLMAPPPQPKILIGYSDTTFLHLFLHKLGWQTIHGSLFGELNHPGKDEENFRLLAELLSGRFSELRYDGLLPANQAARDLPGPVYGAIVGGNLTCLVSAMGTPWTLEPAGKILFLEDVNEPGYKIDRMFTQMRSAGVLDAVAAIVLGEFSRGDKYTEFALERFAAQCGKPVFRTGLFGHGKKNYPLLLNAPAGIYPPEDGMNGFRISINTEKLNKR